MLKKTFRAALSLLLVFSLLLGVSANGLVVLAEGNDEASQKGTLNYVSLGDSMTNGYCFTGYNQGSITAEQFLAGNGVYGNDAYPNLFKVWLEENTGKTVNHSQLAVSAMRAEDLNYLLGGREMPTDGWFDQVEHYSGTNGDALKGIYQEAIEDADVVTMSIGNAAFGAYMVQYFTRMLGVMGGSLPEEEKVNLEKALEVLDAEQKAVILDAYNEMMSVAKDYLPADEDLGPIDGKVNELIDMMAYIGVGFILNYEGVLEQMVELNPDVEVVLIGLMNTTYGMEITGEGFDPIPLGDIVDVLFDSMNAYIAGLPAAKQLAGEWTEAKFYYTDMSQPEFIVQVFDDLYEEGWPANYKGLSGETVRARTIKAYNDALAPMIGLALGFKLPAVDIEDVENFVLDGNYDIDSAVLTAKWTEEVGGLSAADAAIYGAGYEAYGPYAAYAGYTTNKQISVAIYMALEEALAKSVDTLDITLDGLLAMSGDIMAALGNVPEAIKPENEPSPKTINEALVGWFTGSDTALGMCKIFAMFKVGDGMSVHPTPAAHAKTAEAVIAAYSKEYTANQKTLENVLYLINEYYDDAYAYAYQYALANGYIDEAIVSIDGIIAEIQSIDLNKVEMTDAFRAEVAAEAAEIIETLEAAKALLLEADVLDQASLDALLALLNEAAEDILHLEHLLVQAGVDVNQLVIIPVLKAAHTELVEVIIPKILSDLEDAVEAGTAYLMEKLGETYDILVDALMTHISEKLPEIDEWIYNWLYNNPEKVIAFFNEYGDDIVDLMEEYGDEILTALGAVLYLYGEDIVIYLIENRVDLLQNLAKWVSVYGEKIVMMLQVYAEATGLCDLVRGEIADLEAMLAELETELAEQMDLLNNVLMAQLAELEAELARLQAELESAVEAQKPVIEAAIAEIEKQIAELKAMIEEVKAMIAEIQAKIDEIVAMLPMLNEKLNALIDSLLDLDAALEYLLNAGIELGTPVVQNALNAVAKAVAELAGIASESAAAELAKLIEQAKAVLDKAYYDATHTDYHVKPGTSHYVGLGDDMSVASSYVELLAKELGVNFTNMAAAGMSMTDLLYILDENFVADEYTLATFGGDVVALREAMIAELKKADLVTVGVGSFGITDFVSAQAEGALAQILNEQLGSWLEWEFNGTRPIYDEMSKFVDLSATTYSMDWVSYLGEEGTAKLYEMLAEVRADLIEKGVPVVYTYDIGLVINDTMNFPVDIFAAGEIVIDIPVADLMTMMVESYMYAYVTHLSNAGEVFNKIHEIVPGAELLVIGMFNPMDEIVLNLAGTTIALGDYYDYLVDAMNLHYLGYAFVTPNTTFVSVPDAQSMIDVYVDQFENVEDMLMALALGSIESDVDLTEAGHVYVKDQIMNALNVTRGILGDVNDDGYVNSIDAMLIAQYDAWIIGADALNMSVADVNGDGYVNSIDAMLIAQYDAWIIDKFPVEQ